MAKVAICQDVMVEYMGLMCISAVLKAEGHTTELFFDDQTNEDRFIEKLAAFGPDVALFSILSPSVPMGASNWEPREARNRHRHGVRKRSRDYIAGYHRERRRGCRVPGRGGSPRGGIVRGHR